MTVTAAFPSLVPALAALPKPAKQLSYGTAGFRDRADLLDSTFLRMGVLAALRSRTLGGSVIGLMVTASHNPVQDNGVKMVDPNGGMLAMAWESHAARLANAGEAEAELAGVVDGICAEECIDLAGWKDAAGGGDGKKPPARVFVARDTRPHSAKLAALAVEGALLLAGTQVLDLGVMTTPQLHHCVRMENGIGAGGGGGGFVVHGGREEWKGEDGYVRLMASAFLDLIATATDDDGENDDDAGAGPTDPALWVDCAHGVGALKLPAVVAAINNAAATTDGKTAGSEAAPAAAGTGGGGAGKVLEVTVVNGVDEEGGELNEGCGAEFVQKGQAPPKGQDKDKDRGRRWASFDGDADRLVYHYYDADGKWHLLDGDKLATLAAAFLMAELRHLPPPPSPSPAWRVAVVQTAYANGASTRYLRSKGVPVAFAKTGVKFVHHEAEKYDLGIYFEANGHGTVLFGDALTQALLQHQAAFDGDAALRAQRPRACLAARRLLLSQQLVNQAVGDAASDLLFIEAVLRLKRWNVQDWDTRLYTDLPSRQLKLRVADRSVVSCNADETQAVRPADLQPALEALMGKEEQGRAFVRPSGTEDVVRIYAEAATQAGADRLAAAAAALVYDTCGGVGERPSQPSQP